jgi:predicted deacetylase
VLSSCDLVPWGFVPPAGLASGGTIRTLQALGYRYVSTTLSVVDLWTRRRVRCISRSHRPGAVGQTVGRWVVRSAGDVAVAGRPVRLALHPADLEQRGLRRDTLRTIDRILAAGARPSTYLDLFDPAPGDGHLRVGA